MAKKRSDLDKLLGQLISKIQKEWEKELGYGNDEATENVMNKVHTLLLCERSGDTVKNVLNGQTLTSYLGREWIVSHPQVIKSINLVEELLD
jgi:hypothetical protein